MKSWDDPLFENVRIKKKSRQHPIQLKVHFLLRVRHFDLTWISTNDGLNVYLETGPFFIFVRTTGDIVWGDDCFLLNVQFAFLSAFPFPPRRFRTKAIIWYIKDILASSLLKAFDLFVLFITSVHSGFLLGKFTLSLYGTCNHNVFVYEATDSQRTRFKQFIIIFFVLKIHWSSWF